MSGGIETHLYAVELPDSQSTFSLADGINPFSADPRSYCGLSEQFLSGDKSVVVSALTNQLK